MPDPLALGAGLGAGLRGGAVGPGRQRLLGEGIPGLDPADGHWPGAHWSEKTRKLIADGHRPKVEVRQSSYYDPELGGWRIAVQEKGDGLPVVWDSARDRTNPWIIFRYWTTPGDPWGRGPVMLALPNIRTANKTVEMILTAAAYQLAPPLMVGPRRRGQPRHHEPVAARADPRGAHRRPDGPSIAPCRSAATSTSATSCWRTSARASSANLLDSQLPPDTGAVRSASEIIERTKDLQYDAGAAFGRLNHEFVPQVVARVIDLLDRRKVAGHQLGPS
jgi:hypothetical protein